MDYEELLRKSIESNEREAKELLSKERQKKVMELTKVSGIPKRFRGASLKDYKGKAQIFDTKTVEVFLKDFPNTKGLLLTGDIGTGKTHLALALGNELIDRFYSVYFGNVVDILSFIKSTYSSSSNISEEQAIDIMTQKVDLFIIDDLGKENNTEYTLSMLYQLINRVYENEKTIIITTNETSQELVNKLGGRGQAIISRITEMCKPLVFKGNDRRLGK